MGSDSTSRRRRMLGYEEAADLIANEIIKKEKDQHSRERKMMSYREETNQ